jgi:hypothetical protein
MSDQGTNENPDADAEPGRAPSEGDPEVPEEGGADRPEGAG